MEMRVAGGSLESRFEYAISLIGKEVTLKNVMQPGAYADITAVTTGKGTQGPVKRWGIKLRKRKHSRGGKKRHVGTLGPWNPHHVRWQVPQAGQMGYQQRTEFNKRILRIGDNGKDVTPAGGFLHYGMLNNPYVLVKGSIPVRSSGWSGFARLQTGRTSSPSAGNRVRERSEQTGVRQR